MDKVEAGIYKYCTDRLKNELDIVDSDKEIKKNWICISTMK
jgi:hypothetical protein